MAQGHSGRHRELRETVGKSPRCGLHGKKWMRQGEQVSDRWVRIISGLWGVGYLVVWNLVLRYREVDSVLRVRVC